MTSAQEEPGFAGPRPVPPGQRLVDSMRPHQYGRIPKIDLATWSLSIQGATADGGVTRLVWDDIVAMPHIDVVADQHCATRESVQDIHWSGPSARSLLDLAPPDPAATHVLVYAVYGYSASVTVDDLYSPRALLATHRDGAPLTPTHGWPLRLVLPHLYGWKGPKWMVCLEYCVEPRRGFWEQRGYHLTGDVWREERYSHQE